MWLCFKIICRKRFLLCNEIQPLVLLIFQVFLVHWGGIRTANLAVVQQSPVNLIKSEACLLCFMMKISESISISNILILFFRLFQLLCSNHDKAAIILNYLSVAFLTQTFTERFLQFWVISLSLLLTAPAQDKVENPSDYCLPKTIFFMTDLSNNISKTSCELLWLPTPLTHNLKSFEIK